VQTCLEKNPEDRWQSAHDLMLHLGRLRDVQSEGASVAHPATKRQTSGRLGAAGLAGLVLGGILADAWFRLQEPKLHANVLRFDIAAPPRASFSLANASVPVIDFSVSPDGHFQQGLRMEPAKAPATTTRCRLSNGVWYRRYFLHEASVDSLEELFNLDSPRILATTRSEASGVHRTRSSRVTSLVCD
jgi:hypothetical protein